MKESIKFYAVGIIWYILAMIVNQITSQFGKETFSVEAMWVGASLLFLIVSCMKIYEDV